VQRAKVSVHPDPAVRLGRRAPANTRAPRMVSRANRALVERPRSAARAGMPAVAGEK
jgi:hypothetical protein